MKRIERVFEYLQEVAKSQDGEKALTATAIADNLGIEERDRNEYRPR